ncbi:hypothetical protein FMM58_05540 [Campylobacter sp. LR291e]|uniref:hypothetical protein n=1 Tax=Campylobacter sp. LR291e TaxID=2593546 RepID=UPI00123B24D3|nr:hypothetical protein [Campylobacter sp. LR291e]KAA6230448.1 hypothetical protein FMM58_05540 [Campylobacter sp. LR291e]
MNISNLNELLRTQILNEGSTLSVDFFTNELKKVKYGCAFFSNDIDELEKAIEQGAFVIVFEKDIQINHKDIFYLKSENLKQSLTNLLRFISEEKEFEFLYCQKIALNYAKAFFINVLTGDIFKDFKLLTNAKKNSLFCFDDKKYLIKFSVNLKELKKANFELLNQSSIFFTNLLCQNHYFKDLAFPYVYAEIFSSFVAFFKNERKELKFDAKKLDFFKIYFINENFEIVDFGKSSRAFIIVFDLFNFEFMSERLKDIKGFKTALNSLFCDFAYTKLSDLRLLKDFRYCLLQLENEEEFLKEFSQKQIQERSLFD